MRNKTCATECNATEFADEAKIARTAATANEVHFGYLCGIMVEQGTYDPEGVPRRDFKYRVVFSEIMSMPRIVKPQELVQNTHLFLP